MARILVAEDDAAVRESLRRYLAAAGHEVLVAADGRAAMELADDQPADLYVIDIFMPDMDGMEFTIRLRRRMPNARIIVISGGGVLDTDDALEIAKRFGVSRTLAKPFTSEDLLTAVQEVLQEEAGGESGTSG